MLLRSIKEINKLMSKEMSNISLYTAELMPFELSGGEKISLNYMSF